MRARLLEGMRDMIMRKDNEMMLEELKVSSLESRCCATVPLDTAARVQDHPGRHGDAARGSVTL